MGPKIHDAREKGSLTVEAALILPLYFVMLLFLISIGLIMGTHIKIKHALCEEAEKLSLECMGGYNIALSDIREDLLESLDEQKINYSLIRGKKQGIDLSSSNVDDPEYIELSVDYYIVLPMGNVFDFAALHMTQRSFAHVWCGYVNGYLENGDQIYVYITEGSSVYHMDRECTHIKLSISSVSGQDISGLRNNEGAKYYSCEICHSSLEDERLYITADGNRYHNRVTCSGLKRTVRAINIKNVGNRRPCLRCAR